MKSLLGYPVITPRCQKVEGLIRCAKRENHEGDCDFTDWNDVFHPIHPQRAALEELLSAFDLMEAGPGMRGVDWVAFKSDRWEAVKRARQALGL